MLVARSGKDSIEDCKEIFCDLFNRPDSICRRSDGGDPEPGRVQTVASIIMNLTKRRCTFLVPLPVRTSISPRI